MGVIPMLAGVSDRGGDVAKRIVRLLGKVHGLASRLWVATTYREEPE